MPQGLVRPGSRTVPHGCDASPLRAGTRRRGAL